MIAGPGDERGAGGPQRSRLVAYVLLGAIAVASGVALLWPVISGRADVAAVSAGVVLRQIEDPDAGSRPGSVAPDFEWARPDGTVTRLSELRGRVVVLNFWATWCEPCRREMPALDRAARDPEVAVIAVDLDEPADRVDGFIAAHRLSRLEAVIDPGKRVARRYGVVNLPSTYFIDRAGVVRHLEPRELDDAAIRAGVERARRGG